MLTLIKRDLKYGTRSNLSKFVFTGLLFLFINLINIYNFSEWVKIRNISLSEIHFVDLFYEVFKGCGFDISIPIIWLMINSFLAYIIGNYAYEDLHLNGAYLLTRANNFWDFWTSKVIWVITNICIFYIITFVVLMIVSKAFLQFDFDWSLYSKENILALLQVKISAKEFMISTVVLYLSSSIAISILQIALSIAVKPIYAFFVVISIISISIFTFTPLLPGQHSLIMRHILFDSTHNLTVFKSLFYNFTLSLCAFIVGGVYINKTDIMLSVKTY